jgi:NAD+ kinase
MDKISRSSGNDCKIKTVGIVAKHRLEEAAAVITELSDWLTKHRVHVIVEVETAKLAVSNCRQTCQRDELSTLTDLVIVLGGDGTLLRIASHIASVNPDVPILAVNFGSLGFLTETTLSELYSSLELLLAGTAGIDERQMLRSKIIRNGSPLVDKVILNDVVISKATQSSIVEFSITVGNQFVTNNRADGVIIASPTGSTAYNLAAGGPIVHPRVDALLITPIAPHTLTNRPIVIPSTTLVCVTPNLRGSHLAAHASFDGQFGIDLAEGDIVTIERAERPLKVVRAEARNYFEVLHQKLKWGSR